MQIRSMVVCMLAALVGACGGGGGDTGIVRRVAFTSFSEVRPGTIVTVSGISQTQNLTYDALGALVTRTVNAPNAGTSGANLTYQQALPLTLGALEINSPQSNVRWDITRAGQSVTCGGPSCVAASASANGVLLNALDPSLAWNYQTFGYWLADASTTVTVAGAISVGNPTPVGGIPIIGGATYSGWSGGIYTNPAGDLFEHSAPMTAIADFTNRTIDYSTTSTLSRPLGSAAAMTAAPGLDITTTTTLSYAPGTNQFSGAVTTSGMNGTAVGRFYGPAAQEIGGTYRLTNGAIEAMIGAFGGKR